jgi:hypothetical protein
MRQITLAATTAASMKAMNATTSGRSERSGAK